LRIVEVNAFHYPFIGGIENRLHHVCRRLGKEHEVFVLTSRLPGTEEREKMDNYTVIRLPSRYLNIYNPPYVRIAKVREALNDIAPDIVDLHYRWDGSLIKGVLGYDGPKVYTCHNTLGEGVGLTHYASELNDRLFLRHLRAFDRIVCVSDYMRRDVAARGFPDRQLTTIYNGVELPQGPVKDGDFILSLGRLVRLKGLDVLIRAMKHTRCQLNICGEGPERKRLEGLSHRLGLTDRIDFLGWVSEAEKHRLLSECRMFVIPSLHEAYGMVAAEAMAYGKPVIASDTGGLPEVVGDAGVLVPTGDVEGLARAINALDGDQEGRDRLGRAARERMRAFTWDEIADRTEELYLEVAGRR